MPRQRRKTDREPKLRVLLAERDERFRERIEKILAPPYAAVQKAGNDDEAIEKLETASFDIALLGLPRMKGGRRSFLARIRSRDELAHLLLVGIHSGATPRQKACALEDGFDNLLDRQMPERQLRAELKACVRLALRQRELAADNRHLYGLAMRDELTGLFNRRYFFSMARQLLASPGDEFGLILFDLDDFKAINDRWGHPFGDHVLADIGSELQKRTRRSDFMARYGGDEFVLFLKTASQEGLETAAERVTSAVRSLSWPTADGTVSVNITSGMISTLTHPGSTLEELVSLCDRDLYRRKRLSKSEQSSSSHAPAAENERRKAHADHSK